MKKLFLKKILAILLILSTFLIIFTNCSNAIESPPDNPVLSNNAFLSSLVLTKNGKVIPLNFEFDKNLKFYSADLTCDSSNESAYVQIVAEKEDSNSSMKVNGDELESSAFSELISVTKSLTDPTIVEVEVNSHSGKVKKKYIINIFRVLKKNDSNSTVTTLSSDRSDDIVTTTTLIPRVTSTTLDADRSDDSDSTTTTVSGGQTTTTISNNQTGSTTVAPSQNSTSTTLQNVTTSSATIPATSTSTTTANVTTTTLQAVTTTTITPTTTVAPSTTILSTTTIASTTTISSTTTTTAPSTTTTNGTTTTTLSPTSYYKTNPNGQVGKYKTTMNVVCAQMKSDNFNDWSADMIIAQGVGNDIAQSFRGSHEAPIYDTYSLYAAWDDANLYLGWQFVNVVDVTDPAQGFPISDNGKPWNGNIPQMLAFDIDPSKNGVGTLADGTGVWAATGKSFNLFNNGLDTLAMFSSKPGVGQPGLFSLNASGFFDYTAENCKLFSALGIIYGYIDGLLPESIYGINKPGAWAGYTPEELIGTDGFVNFVSLGHDGSKDTFYEMKIPFTALGITKEYIESTGIGVMHISTFGESAIGSIPYDSTVYDNYDEPYGPDASTSKEKEDLDNFTSSMARIGKL